MVRDEKYKRQTDMTETYASDQLILGKYSFKDVGKKLKDF